MRQDIAEFAIPALIWATVVVTVFLLGTNIYGRYLRISRWKAVLLLLAALVVAIGAGFWRCGQINSGQAAAPIEFNDRDFSLGLSVVFAGMLPLALFPFLAKLYLTWVAGAVTEAEKAPGTAGFRSWLRGGNLACAGLIAICSWIGFGYAFLSPFVLALLALLAYPLLNMAMTENSSPAAAPPPAAGAVAPERERVLKLLDEGKITAAECAELLNALGQTTVQPHAPPTALATHRKTVFIGAALLLVGFFLPWLVVNMGDVNKELMNQMPFPQAMPNLGAMTQAMTSGPTFHATGGDIAYGLGWFVLLFGVAAAVLPYLAANLDSETTQKVSLIVLSLGAIILLYIFTQNFRVAGIGLLLGLTGYAVEFFGVVKARRLDWLRAR